MHARTHTRTRGRGHTHAHAYTHKSTRTRTHTHAQSVAEIKPKKFEPAEMYALKVLTETFRLMKSYSTIANKTATIYGWPCSVCQSMENRAERWQDFKTLVPALDPISPWLAHHTTRQGHPLCHLRQVSWHHFRHHVIFHQTFPCYHQPCSSRPSQTPIYIYLHPWAITIHHHQTV